MAKVYSRSQGKVIDQPEAGGGGMGMGGLGGGDQDQMKQLFTLLMLQNPKDISKLSSLYKFIAPPEQTGAERKEDKAAKDSITAGLSKLNEISSILDKYQGQNIAGFGPGLKTKIGRGFSPEGPLGGLAPSQATNTLQAAFSDYNTRLFEIAGKAFTGPEKEILEGLVLDIKDDEIRTRTKISQAEQMIKLRAKNLGVEIAGLEQLQQQPGIPGQAPGVTGAAPTTTGRGGDITNLIPLLTSLLGGAAGSLVGPWGTVAGGGLGQFAGTQIQDLLQGQQPTEKSVGSGMSRAAGDMALRTLFAGGPSRVFESAKQSFASPQALDLMGVKSQAYQNIKQLPGTEAALESSNVARDIRQYLPEIDPTASVLEGLQSKSLGMENWLKQLFGVIPRAVGQGVGFGLGAGRLFGGG